MAVQPINKQPMPGQSVPGLYVPPPPPSIPGCPPGLEYLASAEYILVKQKVELLEVLCGCETENKYVLSSQLGHQVYFAQEDTNCCIRNCCGPSRPFDMQIFDNYRQKVMHLYRPLRSQHCCCPCCLQSLKVSSGQGQYLGSVKQKWSPCKQYFDVKNAANDVVLRIKGPCITSSCCFGDVDFRVMSLDGTIQVGKISKHWSGLVKEAFTDADNFGVSFRATMDVGIKAVLLGACFLIDYMFFESAPKQDNTLRRV